MIGDQPYEAWQLCFPLYLHAGGSDFRLYDSSNSKTYLLMRWQGPDALAAVRPTRVYLLDFCCFCIQLYILLSYYLSFIFLYLDLYVLGEDAWISKGSFMHTKLLCTYENLLIQYSRQRPLSRKKCTSISETM